MSNQIKTAELNDAMRAAISRPVPPNRVLMTAGVSHLGAGFGLAACAAVSQYDFAKQDPGNDPYGEHDFGVFDIEGTKFYFKIDYYAKGSDHGFGSEDPADADKTERVLTIMLAEEY